MATALRPQMLRQLISTPTPARCFSSSLSSSVPAFRAAAQLSRQQQALVRSALPAAAIRIAAFHNSQPRPILPPLPQVIKGTINDAATVPDPSAMHGSYHWSFERLMSAALIPLTIAPFAAGSLNPAMDALLGATLIIHSHIGFESCIIDYFPSRRTPKTKKFLMWALKAGTVAVGVGLYEFETNDVGLTEGIKRIWKA